MLIVICRLVLGVVAVLLCWGTKFIISECPLDIAGSNFADAASVCASQDRENCCRYVHGFVAVAIARYANSTGQLGVTIDMEEICLTSISQTLKLYGVPSNSTVLCGLGVKIPVDVRCEGRSTVDEMLQVTKFSDVVLACASPLTDDANCQKCLNATFPYLRRLVGLDDNTALSTCRDATFVTIASEDASSSAFDIASCFYGVKGLSSQSGIISVPSSEAPLPVTSPSPPFLSPVSNQLPLDITYKAQSHPYRLTLVQRIGVGVTGISFLLLIVLIFLIHQKSKELKDSVNMDPIPWKDSTPHWKSQKRLEGPSCMFRRFSYKETKKATNNLGTEIGKGGFGTVYKAQFSDGFVAAVKRMDKVSVQGEDEFCREMELLGRLHHRHLVCLRGFCIEQTERFLIYEYMENGSLKDRLHAPGKVPLSWKLRVQIAIDVANALEYLHFYCDPPLCHRDIKSSNILLDDNFVAKVADFGLAHAARSGAVTFEPVNTDIRGTPGYMDPEYVVTQELTEKSDIYSYGVLLLELITARRAIQDNRNLVEWLRKFMMNTSRLPELVDPLLGDAYDFDQLQNLVRIVRWCTQMEGRSRPSVKQVLRLLHESFDPVQSCTLQYKEDDECGMRNKGKTHRSFDASSQNGDATRYLHSSSSTSRSYCSKTFLLDTGSPGLSV